MKTIKLLLIGVAALTLQSCYKPGDIQIQNKITQVTIEDVRWGDLYIAYELIPGESSGNVTIRKYDEKLPASHNVSFKMTANNKSIYLQTEEEYYLDEDGDLLIILTDDTKVRNPNE